MTTNNLSSLQQLIAAPTQTSGNSNVFLAMAEAFGRRLDQLAQNVADKSAALNQDGNETPGNLTLLTAAAAELNFNSTSAQNSLSEYSNSMKSVAKSS